MSDNNSLIRPVHGAQVDCSRAFSHCICVSPSVADSCNDKDVVVEVCKGELEEVN